MSESPVPDRDGFGLTLAWLLDALRGYGRTLLVSATAALVIIGGVAVFMFVSRPIERQASIEFRLTFEGIERDQYPNGVKFSRAEIISSPVLTQVFQQNELSRYLSYDLFERAVFVLESSKDLELLALEYEGKLSDTKLTAVERTRLEAEYRQKREALKVAQYTLNLILPGDRTGLPSVLANKVLNDILSEWATEAATQKGALRYQNAVYTPALLKQQSKADSPLVRLDYLKGQIQRLLASESQIAILPGANSLRFGAEGMSLPDLRASLEDILRYDVRPLIDVLVVQSPNREADASYLRERLRQSQIEQQTRQGYAASVQESFRQYVLERGGSAAGDRRAGAPGTGGGLSNEPTLIPQLSESFLDKLVQMSGTTQSADMLYRQGLIDKMITEGAAALEAQREVAYYDDLLKRTAGGSGRATGDVGPQIDQFYRAVGDLAVRTNEYFEALSKNNLNPRTNLFALAGPFTQTTVSGLKPTLLLVYALLTSMVAIAAILLGCLGHHYLKSRPARPRP